MSSIEGLINQLPEEKIIRVLHCHPFVILRKAVLFLLLMLVPALFFEVIKYINATVWESPVLRPIFILLSSGYLLFMLLLLLYNIIDYTLDIWVVTDKRIIDVRQQGFFARTIVEQRLSKIQDVTSHVHGIVATVFRYGDIHVQTAAEQTNFVFDDVPNPEGVRDLIVQLAEENKELEKGE